MSWLDTLRAAPGPPVALEFTARRVSAAALETRGRSIVVSAHAAEPLPVGALVPSLTATNVHDRPVVAAAVARVLERVGWPRRIGIVVPDLVAKVSLLRFEQVPDRASDLDQLIRWQVRKAAPFPIEDAQVAYERGIRAADGQEFVVTLARRSVIEDYEAICADAGAHAGIVDIATFNVANAVLASGAPPSGDWLLVHIAPDYASIAILRGDDLIFFRNRVAAADGTLADVVHQSAMYYEDRLQGAGFTRVFVAGAAEAGALHAADLDALRRTLQDRLATAVEVFDPRDVAALTDRIAAAPALLDTLTPLVGLLRRSA